MSLRLGREADVTGIHIGVQAFVLGRLGHVAYLDAVHDPVVPRYLRIGDAAALNRRLEVVGQIGIQIEPFGRPEKDHGGRILRDHVDDGRIRPGLFQHLHVMRLVDLVARDRRGVQLVAGIVYHVVEHETALAVEVHRLGIGLRMVDAMVGHHDILAGLQREIRPRAREHPDTVGYGGVITENDVARRVGARPGIGGLRVVGGDHRQAQPVEVIGFETVVVQDDIFVVGISPRRRRILHAAARVDLLDEDRTRLGKFQRHVDFLVLADKVDLLDRTVEYRRIVGQVEHRETVMPGSDAEPGVALRIGQGGINIARIAVGEFHRDAFAQIASVPLGIHGRHTEFAQRTVVRVPVERRATGHQQTGQYAKYLSHRFQNLRRTVSP